MITMLVLLAGLASQPVTVAPVRPTGLPTSALSPPAPPPASSTMKFPSRASGSLSGLFSNDDYPAAALREEEQGAVAFSFTIDRGGRVTDCTITTSSGSASLDATTCEIVRSRARLTPAHDARGRPIEDRASHRIRWVLPPSPPHEFADQTLAFVFTIDEQRKFVACRTEGNAKRPPDDKICPLELKEARRMVANAGDHVDFRNRELVLGQGVLTGGPDVAKTLGRKPREDLGGLIALALEIDAEGNVSRCIAEAGSHSGKEADEGCARTIERKFVPLDPAASDRSARYALKYEVIYTRPRR